MFIQVTQSDFHDAFVSMGREDQFTYAGRKALFEYLEEYEESRGDPVELDVVALCCDYSEYSSLQSCEEEQQYGIDLSDCETDDEKDDVIRDYLNDHTQLIEFDGGIIIAAF